MEEGGGGRGEQYRGRHAGNVPFLREPYLKPSNTMYRHATVCDMCGTLDGNVDRSTTRDSLSSWLGINTVLRCAAKLATVSFVPFFDINLHSK